MKSKTNLLLSKIEETKRTGQKADLLEKIQREKTLSFSNLDVDSIKPKKLGVEYSSVKLKTELFEKVKKAALQNGVKQPGKFISLILESYLKQANVK